MNKNSKPTTQKSKILLLGLKNLRKSLTGFSLDQFVISTLEMLMYLERDEYLEELNKRERSKDKGNGTYLRSFKSFSRNALVIRIPRTRYTDFKPLVLEFLKYSQEQVNELVLKLYRKGLTTRDISDILKNFFGEEMSYAQVSNLAEKFNEARKTWEKIPLDSYYKVIYCDALYMTLRRGKSYSKEAVHIIYGIRSDNKRELLSLSVFPTETRQTWAECLSTLKSRSIEKVDLVVADGIKGFEDEVHKYFPGTLFQKCVLHKMRNVLNKIRPKDKKEVTRDLKEVFNNFDSHSSTTQAFEKLERFIDKWKSCYPQLKRYFADDTIEYYFSYIKFPYSFRKMIYTTNSIENLNKKIRKATKNKQSFEKADRLLDYLFIIIKDFEYENWMKYPLSAFVGWEGRTQSN
jgi:transposase-like protein